MIFIEELGEPQNRFGRHPENFLTLPGLEIRPLCRLASRPHVQIYGLFKLNMVCCVTDRLCGLVVRVLGYRSGGPGSIPGTTKKK
jgi:hypothetical protein